VKKPAQQYTAFAFGGVFVVVLIVLALKIPNPRPFQYIVFRAILALAAAGVAAMIPGFIQIQFSQWLRAGGALAVFVVVYFYNPVLQQVLVPPLEATVTLEAGNYDASELLRLLSEETGGVIVEPKLLEKLKSKKVRLTTSPQDVSLKAMLDLVFRGLGVDVEYKTDNRTVVLREKGASQ
jgi:hypothetical protein